MATCTVVSALLLGVSYSLAAVPEGLNILESTDTKLKGTFATGQGHGVYFSVGGQPDNSATHMHIASLDGRNILRIQDLHDKQSLLTIQDKTILRIPGDGRAQSRLYEVSPAHMAMAQMTMLLEGRGQLTDLLKGRLQEIDDDDGIGHLMNLLRQKDDLEMIANAASAVAEASGERVLSPAARSFVMTAMGLKHANMRRVSRMGQLQTQAYEGTEGPRVCHKNINIQFSRMEIHKKTGRPGFSDCTGDKCVRSYKAKGYNNECFGMCGPECMCWKWACGDCCVHTYCDDHDYCCSKPGLWATVRCYAPLSMASCEQAYRC